MSLDRHLFTPGATARGLGRDDVVVAGFEGDLVGQFGLGAVPQEQVAAGSAGAASGQAPRAAASAIGLQRDGRRVAEDLDVTAEAQAPGPAPPAAGAVAQLVPANPERVGGLAGLGRGGLGVWSARGQPRPATAAPGPPLGARRGAGA